MPLHDPGQQGTVFFSYKAVLGMTSPLSEFVVLARAEKVSAR